MASKSRSLGGHADVRAVFEHPSAKVPCNRHDGLLAGLLPICKNARAISVAKRERPTSTTPLPFDS
jgi:hypothetical protein